jgi:hypothetical protein
MPRNLTDLMEAAVSTAPPEPHHASDITRLAERHRRRRTTFVAGATAVAVIAVAGGAFGLTRGHATAPEPATSLLHDQTVDASQAVPASSLPGYTAQPWTIRSVQRFQDNSANPTYQAVDSAGRLLVVDTPDGTQVQGPFRARLYDAPGGAAQPLQAPASPGTVGSVPISWLPEFYGTGHLLWHQSTGAPGFHITDLQGGHDEFVPATFRVGTRRIFAHPDDVTAGSMWMTVPVPPFSKTGFAVSDVYRGTSSGSATKVGTGVSALDVGPGMAGWVTTHGQVLVQSATGAPPEQVPVPLDKGCRVLPARSLQSVGFAVTTSAVALTELCGSGDKATQQLLAFDLSGRPLVRITGVTPFNMSFAGDTLLFQANEMVLRYDLATGTLSQLNAPKTAGYLQPPRGAGSYVLWYDTQGGHVAVLSH